VLYFSFLTGGEGIEGKLEEEELFFGFSW